MILGRHVPGKRGVAAATQVVSRTGVYAPSRRPAADWGLRRFPSGSLRPQLLRTFTGATVTDSPIGNAPPVSGSRTWQPSFWAALMQPAGTRSAVRRGWCGGRSVRLVEPGLGGPGVAGVVVGTGAGAGRCSAGRRHSARTAGAVHRRSASGR